MALEECNWMMENDPFMAKLLRDDPFFFDMAFGRYIKDDERSDFNKRIFRPGF